VFGLLVRIVDRKWIETPGLRFSSVDGLYSAARRRRGDNCGEKLLDLGEVSLTVDFECLGRAKIAYRTCDGESLRDAQHLVAEADALHAAGETCDRANSFLCGHKARSRSGRRKVLVPRFGRIALDEEEAHAMAVVPPDDAVRHVYVATKNQGKLRELQTLFASVGWRLEAYADYREPAEGETSYAENAALKARALAVQLRSAGITAPVLGDDSGLEVAALGGRPGVLSARYGGADADWPARRRALLAELAATASPDRSARFVCALHLIEPDGTEYAVLADIAGTLTDRERGAQGFSYDPIFEYPPRKQTFSELSEREKNAVSHRGRAVGALLAARLAGPGAGWAEGAQTGM
jgi:XTP/dITP diphosphohydrolase